MAATMTEFATAGPPVRYLKPCIRCANCNQAGHVYRLCNHPITSFGVICFRVHGGQVQYLQIQRRDSLSYVEFLRGKYNHQNRQYLLTLFSNMTELERQRISSLSFDQLWHELWQVNNIHSYHREYVESKAKFQRLVDGYYLHADGHDLPRLINLANLLAASTCQLAAPEWGWPKGRRNINENDFGCALREFREETGVHPHHVQFVRTVKPFEEVFTGMNKVRYRHVYYLAQWVGGDGDAAIPIDANNFTQVREVQAIRWFDYERAQANIRDVNVERKELFRRVHAVVQRVCSA
jgi:8-oxo-dGTP pyrophosphatase MutT (NUDIX family)